MKVLSVPKINTFLKLGLFILIFRNIYTSSNFLASNEIFETIFLVCGLICLLISIASQKLSLVDIALYSGVGCLVIYNYFITRSTFILVATITIFALRGSNLDCIFRCIFKWKLFFLILLFLLALGSDSWLYSYYFGELKYDFGFSHANTFAMYLVDLTMLWLWVHYEKLTNTTLVLVLLVNAAFFPLVKSDIAFFVVLLSVVMLFAIKNTKHIARCVIHQGAKYIIVISAIFTYVMMELYVKGNAVALVVNELMTARIRAGAYAKYRYGFTFWGQDLTAEVVTWDAEWGMTRVIFDNIYTYMTYNIGFVWLIIAVVFFYKLSCLNHTKINLFIIIWAVYAMAEVGGINGYRLFPVFLFAILLDKKMMKRFQGAC